MRGCAGNDCCVRRGSSHRECAEDGRGDEATGRRVAGEASVGWGGAVDRAVRHHGISPQPEDEAAYGSVQRNLGRNGGTREVLPRTGALYDRAVEFVLYKSATLH